MSNYYYLNHDGKSIDLCKPPIFVEHFREFRSHAWNVSTLNGRLTNFSRRKFAEYKLPICCYADRAHMAEFKDELLRKTETDVLAKTPGRLYINGYFCEGYMFAEDISDYELDGGLCASVLTFLALKAVWVCEKISYEFGTSGIIVHEIKQAEIDDVSSPAPILVETNEEGQLVGSGAPALTGDGNDYPFLEPMFPFGFPPTTTRTSIVNESVSASAFIMTIYGTCTNPSIIINGHTYNVNTSIPSGGELVIDSRNRTIILTAADGSTENKFGERNHDDDKYIFEPIPTGELNITYENIDHFMLTIVDERSVPPWI